MTTSATHRILVRGHLDARWAQHFNGTTVHNAYDENQEPITVLTARFADQAALMGMLRYVNGLGLYLVGVEQISERSNSPVDAAAAEQ